MKITFAEIICINLKKLKNNCNLIKNNYNIDQLKKLNINI